MSYCYIDYSKQNDFNLLNEKIQSSKEIKIQSKHANLYFSISKFDMSAQLFEDSRFILLSDGSLESDDISFDNLLKLFWEEEIEKVLEKVDGVFSLTLFDKKRELLYLSRDHFGLIPQYYYQKNDIVLFSNTLKTFKKIPVFEKEIDFNTLGQYLQHGYILQPNTLFKNCYKIKAARVLKFDLSTKHVSEKKYWDIVDFYNLPRVELSEEEIIQKVENLLKSAIKTKIGDSKEVGTFLSGGYDSSTIASLLSKDNDVKLHSFTMGFEDSQLDEAPAALKISKYLKINHHEYYFNWENLQKSLLNFAEVYDEPLSDMAALPTMLICEKSSSIVDILFGGEGGDEIFASSSYMDKFNRLNATPYPIKYIYSKLLKLFTNSEKLKRHSKILEQKNIEDVLKYRDITLNFDSVAKLIVAPISEQPIDFSDSSLNPTSHHLDKIFPSILNSYVSNNLLNKVYFAANANHIKIKLPFLNRKFVEFLATVDVKVKHTKGINKYILKQILQKYIPNSLMDRPKKGFSTPAGEILKNELKTLLDEYINENRLTKEGIFDPVEVMKIKNRFLNSNSYSDNQNIWSILIFQLWHEYWFSE